MKKFVCSLLLSIMMLNMFVPVYAQEKWDDLEIMKHAEQMLISLGIVENTLKADEEYYKEITRGEFTKMAVCLLGDVAEEYSDSSNYFIDTNDIYINKAYSMGLVSGTNYKTFEPDSLISAMDSSVIVLRVLGYEKLAELNGNYPNGYMHAAEVAELFEDVLVSKFNYGYACVMLKNALFAPLCEYLNHGVSINNDENYLSFRYDAVYEKNQVVKQAAFSSATGVVNSHISEGFVKIGDTIYDCGDVNTDGFLGYNVEYIYRRDNGEYPVLLYIAKYKTKEIEIDIADIEQVNQSKIRYNVDGKSKYASIEQNCNFIYNGDAKPDMRLTDIDPETMSGKVTLLSNKNSTIADTVIIWEYKDYVFSYADSENKIIYCDGSIIDMSDADLAVVYSDEGNIIDDISTINEESVLSVYESFNKNLYKIIVTSRTVEAEIISISGSERFIGTVNGELKYSYAFNKDINNVNLGNSYVFLLNFNGEVIALSQYDKIDNYTYGYMHRVMYDSFDEVIYAKIFDITGTHHEYYFTEKVTIDGTKTKASSYYTSLLNMPKNDPRANPQMVKFKLNSGGKISELDTMVKGIYENDNSLHVKSNISSEWRGRQGNFIMTDETSIIFMGDTVIFDVPRDGSTLLNSRLPKAEFRIFFGEGDLGSYYGKLTQFDAVDVDEMGFSDIMVRYNAYNSTVKPGGNIKPVVSSTSSNEDLAYMVIDVVTVANKDCEPMPAIKYFDFKDQLVKRIIPVDSKVILKPVLDSNGQAMDGLYKSVERGDIITMSVNYDGELVGINVCYDSSLTGNARFKHNQGDYDYGIAYNKGGASFAIASALVENAPTYDGSNAAEVFDFSQINIHRFATLLDFTQTVPMVVYDTELDEIRTGRLSDIRTYKMGTNNPSLLIYNTSIWANTLYIIN